MNGLPTFRGKLIGLLFLIILSAEAKAQSNPCDLVPADRRAGCMTVTQQSRTSAARSDRGHEPRLGTRRVDTWRTERQPRSTQERARQGRDIASQSYRLYRCVEGGSLADVAKRALQGCGREAQRLAGAVVQQRLEYVFTQPRGLLIVVTDPVRNDSWSAPIGDVVEVSVDRDTDDRTRLELIVRAYDAEGLVDTEVFDESYGSSRSSDGRTSRGAKIVQVTYSRGELDFD